MVGAGSGIASCSGVTANKLPVGADNYRQAKSRPASDPPTGLTTVRQEGKRADSCVTSVPARREPTQKPRLWFAWCQRSERAAIREGLCNALTVCDRTTEVRQECQNFEQSCWHEGLPRGWEALKMAGQQRFLSAPHLAMRGSGAARPARSSEKRSGFRPFPGIAGHGYRNLFTSYRFVRAPPAIGSAHDLARSVDGISVSRPQVHQRTNLPEDHGVDGRRGCPLACALPLFRSTDFPKIRLQP